MMTSRTCAAIASVIALAACSNASTDELGNGARVTHPSGVVDEPDQAPSTDTSKSNNGGSQNVTGATGNGSGTGAGNGTGGGNGGGSGSGSGTTSVLNTFSKIWINGDNLGPNKIGKNTGAGTMDAHFDYAVQPDGSVLLATLFTRSANTPNNNDSYMQGGFAVAKLTATGVDMTAPMVELPVLQGERAFMRPQPLAIKTASGQTKWLLIAASEDNGVNNNPQPVAFLVDQDGKLLTIKNNTRKNISKPTNLIQQALQDGVTVQNPNNQRGPHSYAKITDNSYVIGMQYNNQAAEAFRVTVSDDNSVNINWLNRYSNNAQHCRPQVALGENGTGYITSVEANTQPADIGARLTSFAVDTGKAVTSKIILRSDKQKGISVAEPSIGFVKGKISIAYAMSAAQRNRADNNTNGHGNQGSQVGFLALFDAQTLAPVGTALQNAAQYGRHNHSFVTTYGPNAEPALGVISGSSDGLRGGFLQLVPFLEDGTLGKKDALKMYKVSDYSDVANVQARGKRNPNDQAKGFINGVGGVVNPGFDPTGTKTNTFMPETKTLSFTTITGYSGPDAASKRLKDSIYLTLVPASWRANIATTPGLPTSTPGTNPDGTGPAPTTTTPGVDPSGNAGGEDQGDGVQSPNAPAGTASGGCNVASNSNGDGALVFLAIAGVLAAARRSKKSEEV